MKNLPDRELKQLSAYLDGQLSSSESAQVESRISSDPEFASAFNDIRAARSILRKLPARKAPRNFTLTRQMVGLKPPLPRSYFAFRFSSAFAALLLIFTVAANLFVPPVSLQPATSFSFAAGSSAAEPVAPEIAPAATAAPAAALDAGLATPAEAPAANAAAATQAPAVQAPSSAMVVAPTELPSGASADSAREAETLIPNAKVPVTVSAAPNQLKVSNEAFIPIGWQIGLFILCLISAIIAYVINQNAKKKWS